VEDVRPDQVTLVPDDIRQATSDHGWDIGAHKTFLIAIIARLKESGARVSVFVDPEPPGSNVVALAADVGADRVEIFTGPYGGTFEPVAKQREFDKVVATGNAARNAGLGLNAGHDLTLDNLPPLVRALPQLAEVSIGHALTADALIHGMGESVRLYRAACGDPVA
jgi:pyridoxine 5-phosphate synthase